jgi:hypothetical protein
MKFKLTTTCIISGLILLSSFLTSPLIAKVPEKQFYQLIVYHIKDKAQEETIDKYLSEAYLPAIHRQGIPTVGVFKTANIDTATNKRIYVLIPYQSFKQFSGLQQALDKDKELASKGADYINAPFGNAPYLVKESIFMQAFDKMPVLKKPTFSSPKSERIYELRSYRSDTEKLYHNKVQMFNQDEMEIFERIGSQPVFYGEVLFGSQMPNLMYMTTYANKADRDAHWKTFGSDPKWKSISALPKYKNNMTKADVQFLTPADYSDF